MTPNLKHMNSATTATLDPDEKFVEEAHCSECNKPIPAIPNWYAQVRVKFTCDDCRQKSPRLVAAALPPAAVAVEETTPVAGVSDDGEPAIDDVIDPELDAELDTEEPEEETVEAEVVTEE